MEDTHLDRMVQEAKELTEKLQKLDAFIAENPIFSTLAQAEQMRMEAQASAMGLYLAVLEQRIQAH